MPQGYISIDDAAEQLKIARGTLYYYIRHYNLETKKFPLDRKAYLPISAFEQVKAWKEQAAEGRREADKEVA